MLAWYLRGSNGRLDYQQLACIRLHSFFLFGSLYYEGWVILEQMPLQGRSGRGSGWARLGCAGAIPALKATRTPQNLDPESRFQRLLGTNPSLRL